MESEVGLGTEFFIYLPVSMKKGESEASSRKDTLERSGFILLVDDEDMILEVGSAMLESIGYKVIQARGGKAGIEEFRKRHFEIDLVILDMIMPDLSGREVFVRMKDLDPKVRVILASGYNMDEQAKEILQNGCRGFIQKPYSINGLSEKVKEVIG